MRFLLPVLFAAALPLQAADLWFHLRVDDLSGDHARVAVNLPYSVVQTVLPAVQKTHSREGSHLRVNDHDVSPAELRRALAALRANPAARVTVNSDDATLELSVSGDNLLIRTNGRRGNDPVEVRTPFDVAEALVASDNNDVNLEAGMRALIRRGRGELLLVTSEEANVRVWIDDRP